MTTDHTPPADRDALRDRIAEALYAQDHPIHLVPLNETGMGPAYQESADAVLAVLPPPVSRADVYREAAQRLRERAEACKSGALRTAFRAAADGLDCDADATDPSRMADEAQPGAEAVCTCADAGDCFAPTGHYADCPARAQQDGARS